MKRLNTWLDFLYKKSSLWQWLLCAIPLWVVLVFTGYVDPAPGFGVEESNFLSYLPVSAIIVFFYMVLNGVKGFLVLRFGKVDCGLLESGNLLARSHGFMLLLEALGTGLLFLMRSLNTYRIWEQTQLFGHELIYASLLGYYLYRQSDASLKRSITGGLLCFLASSAWLLLSVISAFA